MFRERSRLPPQRQQQQAQIAERFLRAIEGERERERKEEYKEALKNMWNRYQDEENAIERELFNENNNIESDYPINYDDDSKKKKKRQRQVRQREKISRKRVQVILIFSVCSVAISRLLPSTGKTSVRCLYFHGYPQAAKSDFP